MREQVALRGVRNAETDRERRRAERSEISPLEVSKSVSSENLMLKDETSQVPNVERVQEGRGGGEQQQTEAQIELTRVATSSAREIELERAVGMRREQDCQEVRDNLGLFKLCSSQYRRL